MPLPKLATVDLNLLVAAEVLLTERSLARAASRLRVTRSAVSHTLSRLREVFGDPLLVRDGNAMTPTARAESLLPALRDVLGRCEEVLTGPSAFDPARAVRRFVMLLSDYAAELIVAPLLEVLSREAPHIDLEVFPARRDFARALAEDVDLTLSLLAEDLPGIITSRAFSDEFVCVLREGHPDAAALTLDRFVALPHALVAPRNLRPSQVDVALSERGLSRRVAVTLPYFAAAPAVLAATDMVLTAPARLSRRLAVRHPLVVVPAPLRLPGFTFRICWHTRVQHDPAHAWLRARLGRLCRAIDASPA
ncbi:Transcriptional regulator [Minicystis rosea]|nr:Transcriptional regulator [Minicystis rosea]